MSAEKNRAQWRREGVTDRHRTEKEEKEKEKEDSVVNSRKWTAAEGK